MEIKGKEVEIKITGKTLLMYKQVFKKDFFNAVSKMAENVSYTDMFEIVYILYKQAIGDGASYSDYENVFMEDLNIGDVLSEETQSELSEAITKSMTTSKEVKTKKKVNQNPIY